MVAKHRLYRVGEAVEVAKPRLVVPVDCFLQTHWGVDPRTVEEVLYLIDTRSRVDYYYYTPLDHGPDHRHCCDHQTEHRQIVDPNLPLCCVRLLGLGY